MILTAAHAHVHLDGPGPGNNFQDSIKYDMAMLHFGEAHGP